MFKPIKILSIELSENINDFINLENYKSVWAFIKYLNVPLGYVRMPVIDGKISSYSLITKAVRKFGKKILSTAMQENFYLFDSQKKVNTQDLLKKKSHTKNHTISISIAVCTRNRSNDLEICLSAISKIHYPNLEVLVVDNAPTDDSTKKVVEKFTNVKYVLESYQGLDWARNKAAKEAKGEIIAYTDDDVVVDENWVNALADIFESEKEVMAVTGLVLPYEIETEAQFLFEKYGGFNRGFDRRWYKSKSANYKSAREFAGAGIFGTGANMAYRKEVFNWIGYFDPALDVGTVTNGGGDLEMFFRVLKEGYCLVYEPRAIVWHRHRREMKELEIQLANNGIGLYSYFTKSFWDYPKERIGIAKLAIWWFFVGNVKRFLMSFPAPHRFPRNLILKELIGSIKGLFRYSKAKRKALKIDSNLFYDYLAKHTQEPGNNHYFEAQTSIIDIGSNFTLQNSKSYAENYFIINYKNKFLGKIKIRNNFGEISRERLFDELINQTNIKILTRKLLHNTFTSKNFYVQIISNSIGKKLKNDFYKNGDPLISIVIATYDRPNDLRECLKSLLELKTDFDFEIVVVDNNPSSGLTQPVISEFSNIHFITESRKGLSYARNRGFIECKGKFAVATDDDVIFSKNWLWYLIAPFKDENVMCVTGNVIPYELKTSAQNLFEIYGGLGRGNKKKYFDYNWFYNTGYYAAATWEIGATANAAFRTSIFKHPEIGLMDESLGPGTPTGVGEDTYLFYKILKSEFSIVYQPDAFVWHKHRKDIKAFKKQLYNYSKGHVAYHLTTYLNDHDLRCFFRILVELPYYHISRIYKRLRLKSSYPIKFIFLEIYGHLVGPFSLVKSKKRVKKLRNLSEKADI